MEINKEIKEKSETVEETKEKVRSCALWLV